MTIEQALDDLVRRFGPQILDDPDDLRSLLEDVLPESASGDANIVVDAVRYGAVDRMRSLMSHGADPMMAVESAGGALADSRGATDADTARWACAVVGSAAGVVPAEVATRTAQRSASAPASASAPIDLDKHSQHGAPRGDSQPGAAPSYGAPPRVSGPPPGLSGHPPVPYGGPHPGQLGTPPPWRSPAGKPHPVSWAWALIPLFTFGLGTSPVMIYAAARTRNALQAASAVVYTLLMIIIFTIDFDSEITRSTDPLFQGGLVINWLLGTAHAFAIRRWVFTPRDNHQHSLVDQQRAALEANRARDHVRAQALQIVRENPAKAISLGIGRPDLPPDRHFPDGGLVDVNNVPAQVLQHELRLAQDIGWRITETRHRTGGFSSAEELIVMTGIPPQALDHVMSRLIFLPPAHRL